MSYNEEVFKRQYPTVLFFVQHLAYYRGLWALGNEITEYKPFWASTTNSHLLLTSIAWCNVFGSRKEDMHWTKVTTGEIPEQLQKDFRQRVLANTGYSLEQWETYQKDMLGFRNKFVAHVESKHFKGPVPSFDPALEVAYAYQEWIRELIRPAYLNQPTLSSQYEELKAEASSAVTVFLPRSK